MEYDLELNLDNVEFVYRQCLLNAEECRKIKCGESCVDVTLSDSILEP